MAYKIISTSLILIAVSVFITDTVIDGEFYTSVSDLARITVTQKSIASILDDHIKLEEERLNRLRYLKQTFLRDINKIKSETTNHQITTSQSLTHLNKSVNEIIAHPNSAFVSVKRLIKGIEQIYHLIVEKANENIHSAKAKIEKFDTSLPNEDDYRGASYAMLRLQTCYKLDTHHLAQGRLIGKYNGILGLSTYRKYTDEVGAQLNYDDCYWLGRLVYGKEEYSIAIEWFEEALNLYREFFEKELEETRSNATSPSSEYAGLLEEPGVTEKTILEYMAFSAFKKGRTRYAYEVTMQWLKLEPDNIKAKDNLDYYLSILDRKDPKDSSQLSDATFLLGDTGSNTVPTDKVTANIYINSADHLNLSSENEVTYALCRNENIYPKSLLVQNLNCRKIPAHLKLENVLMLNYKSELLYTSPNIMRIHNFLTNEESRYLKSISEFRLERSTVQTTDGQQPSDLRIAKTAWLDAEDKVVMRIEKRISDLLNLRLEEAENLQVVNYGLGGYYAVHYDFTRSHHSTQKVDLEMSGPIKNDRLATFLIYISDVEAGGATVFPQLGVTVEPIKNSAVVWYNIHKNGLRDFRTRHSGCPVLLGSKWIATKWLREDANSFTRPCSLDPSD